MIDIRKTIAPKSDQLNSDDLIGRTLTIKVTSVSLCTEPDQPVAISFDGDGGKPYKPCKSMRRVLVSVWGPDGNTYAGKSMTLYRDESVKFGGMEVGGIRISHLSHIERPVVMALTATRANKKPFTVKPLEVERVVPKRTWATVLTEIRAKIAACQSVAELEALCSKDADIIKAFQSENESVKASVSGVVGDAMTLLNAEAEMGAANEPLEQEAAE